MKKSIQFPEHDAQEWLTAKNWSKLIPEIKRMLLGYCARNKKFLDEDTIQEVIFGVYKSLKNYNKDKARLFTFITKSIQNNIWWNYSAKKKRRERRGEDEVIIEELTEEITAGTWI